MKKLVIVGLLACGILSGCAALDQAIGSEGKPGPVAKFVRGIEDVAGGSPIGIGAGLLGAIFGIYQKIRAKKYAEGLEGVVVGVDRALEQGVKLSVDKQELYSKIRGGIQEVVGDVAFVERVIAEIKAKDRS